MPRRSRSSYADLSRSRSSFGSTGRIIRRTAYVVIALIVLLIAGGIAQFVRTLPAQRVDRTIATSLVAPGQRPTLPWPTEGQAALAVDGIGTVGQYGEARPVPIASLAKMMTAYQVLHDHPLALGDQGGSLVVTSADVADYQSRVHQLQSVARVVVGERLTEYEALEALLVPSANNVAVMLARWDAGSVPAFVARMNATARQMAMNATHYADPDGFSPQTVSTAVDQLNLAQAAMKLPAFAEIVAKPDVTLPVAGKLFNYNFSVGHFGFIGIKTGSDSAAGGCWAFAGNRVVGGKTRIVFGVVLGQHGKTGELIQPALDEGRKLADAVPKLLQRLTVLPRGTVVGYLRAPWRSRIAIVTQQPITVLVVPGQRVDIALRLSSPQGRHIAAQTVFGDVKVGDVAVPVVLAQDAPGPSLNWRLTRF